jgi:hypothetical protein
MKEITLIMIILIIIIIIIITMKLRNYRKQPYWALHTYFGQCQLKSTVEPTQELEI